MSFEGLVTPVPQSARQLASSSGQLPGGGCC